MLKPKPRRRSAPVATSRSGARPLAALLELPGAGVLPAGLVAEIGERYRAAGAIFGDTREGVALWAACIGWAQLAGQRYGAAELERAEAAVLAVWSGASAGAALAAVGKRGAA